MTRNHAGRAVALLVPGLVGMVLAGCADHASSGSAPVVASASTSSPSRSSAVPTAADWAPIPLTAGAIPAGRQGMTANGRPESPWAVLKVPKGFSTIDGWAIFDEDPKGGGGIGYWTISEVVLNPCGDPQPMNVGRTVADLVAALQRQRLTRMTAPVAVTVDGHRGLSLELSVPEGIDFTTCPDYNLWESDPAGARHMGAAGEFDRLWILDVRGDVLVLTVTADAGVPKSALERLTKLVESVEFVPRSP